MSKPTQGQWVVDDCCKNAISCNGVIIAVCYGDRDDVPNRKLPTKDEAMANAKLIVEAVMRGRNGG